MLARTVAARAGASVSAVPRPPAAALEQCVAQLRARLEPEGAEVTTNPNLLASHGRDESFHACVPPDAVVFAHSTAHVAAAVETCAAHGVPVIPFGCGTSLEGHISAVAGGVSLDVTRMDRVLAVNAEDMDCRCEAGVTRNALNSELRHTGLFFSVDPGADASLGGMTATAASGTTALRYGTMRDNVMAMTVVLPDGRVVELGTRSRKSSAGFDLKSLFVGSEGTLGVITEVALKLHGQPGAAAAAACPFDTLGGACESVIELTQMGIPVARSELLDASAIGAVNKHHGWTYPETPTLFFEFHGHTDTAVEEQAEAVRDICAGHGATGFQWASDEGERRKLWEARHMAYYSLLQLKPGSRGWPTDVCVPISRLAECMCATADDIAATGLVAPILSHAGDGNFHVIMLIHPDDPPEFLHKLEAFNDRLVRRALDMGGTCTGEHGVGLGKMEHLELEHGGATMDLMASVKHALDPHNIMNPGKIVDPARLLQLQR